jgi:hypothetical protein
MQRSLAIIYFTWVAVAVSAPGLLRAAEQPYDIRHYDIWIEPDFAAKRLRITARIEIDNPGHAKDFEFGLSDRYETVRVSADGAPSKFRRENDSVTVTVPQPGLKTVLAFDLEGAPGKSQDNDRKVIDDDSLYLLWSDRFYPIAFDDWATVTTRITIPGRFKVVAPGRLTSIEEMGAISRETFETSQPTLAFSVVADARWIRTERTINGIRMQTLLDPECNRYAEKILSTSAEVLKFYSKTLGPFSFDQFSFVTIPGIYARRAFPGFVGYSPPYLEEEMTRTGHDAHETALLWWGYTARGSGPGSWQWTEGFGDYTEILYDETFHKPIPAIFERFRAEYLKLPAEKDVEWQQLQGDTAQAIVHGKYPWLMHLLRYRMGDADFNRALKTLFAHYRFRTFSMDELIAVFEEAGGAPLAWWRDEWLGRKGVPEISLRWKAEPAGQTYQVKCELLQTGNVYHLPVEIGIKTAGGMQIERVNLSAASNSAVFQSREKPLEVVFDPHRWLLVKLVSGQSAVLSGSDRASVRDPWPVARAR